MAQNESLLKAEKEGKECALVCQELKEALGKAQERCAALEKEVM
jgi:hypothetical protein